MDQAIILKPEDFKSLVSDLKDMLRSELKGYVVEEPLTAKEAARYLKITDKAMWERFRKGTMPAELIHRSGGSVYFFASELHRYLKNK